MQNSFNKIRTSVEKMHLNHLSYSIKDEYNREIYAWQYFEEGCEEWYMDDVNFWDDNYFQLLFDESTPPYVEESEEKVIHISFQLTPFPLDVWVLDPHLTFSSYGDALLDIHDSIYVDPHDQVGHLEHRTQLSITLRAHQLEVNISIWIWDPGLRVSSLDYFSVAVNLCIWDLGSLDYFHNGFNIRIWDPGIHMQLTSVDCLRTSNLRAGGLVMSPFLKKEIIN